MSASSISDEEMFAIVSRHVGATISVYDRSLTFRYVSDGFAAWFGLTPKDIVGRTLVGCYGERNYIRYRPYIDRAMAGEAVAYQRQVRDAAGVDGWRVSRAPQNLPRPQRGRLHEVVAHLRDDAKVAACAATKRPKEV